MSNLHHIADELGDIRALIRSLKTREAELSLRFLDRPPNGQTDGDRWSLSLTTHERLSLDPTAMPPEILGDPRYWKTTRAHRLVCTSLDGTRIAGGADPTSDPQAIGAVGG